MALHPNFPESPYSILNPAIRWFPADEALRESSADKLMPPLVPLLRKEVKQWRDSGYVGATDTSKSLLTWWFKTPHLLPHADGTMAEFQYYFAQREALETIIYLYDVVGVRDKFDLMRFDSSGAVSTGMFDETWRRFVIKMATGSGKTKVLSLVLVWSFFHKLYEPDSELARNFLVIAPNIIVLDRICKDFQGLRVFFEDPAVPDNGMDGRNWRDDFQLTLHVQDDVRITHPTGNIFLTNIHRVYAGDDIPSSPDDENTMDYFLGKRPTGATRPSESEAVTSGNLAGTASFSMASKSPSQGGRLSSDRMSDEQCRGAYRDSAPSSSGPDRAAQPWQTSRDRLLWDGLHGVPVDVHSRDRRGCVPG